MGTLKYYLYLSPAKIEMLFSQLPDRLQRIAGTLSGELKIKLGFAEASLRKGEQPSRELALSEKAQRIEKFLELDTELLGAVDEPSAYFRGAMTMNWGSIREYAADIVFFGGEAPTCSVALVGSRGSLVGGEGVPATSGHAADYYLFSFLSSIDEKPDPEWLRLTKPGGKENGIERLPYFQGVKSFNRFMSRVSERDVRVEFMARTLGVHREGEHRLVIGSPLYVALEDATRR